MDNGEELICSNCETRIIEEDEFCPGCGTIFIEDVFCRNHSDTDAEGVCLICSGSFCKKCGGFYNNVFLCNQHDHYEFYEGMARVFGSNDSLETDYVFTILKQNGLNPFIFSRKSSPISLGSWDYSLFRASGEQAGQTINELKILVPFNEVLQAEEIMKEFMKNSEGEKEITE